MNAESVALVSGAALLASAIGAPQAVADRYPDHGSDPASAMLVRVAGAVEVPSVPASTVQRCRYEEVTVRGTVGPDLIVGTAGADVIWGGPGDDTIRGLAGADVVCAGSGNDVVTAGQGDDLVYGGDGDDVIADPGGGRTTVRAGRGADVVRDNGTAMSDYSYLWGGKGNDHLEGGTAASSLYGGHGRDVLRGGDGYAAMTTGPGRDVAYAGTTGSQVSMMGDGDVYYGGPTAGDTAIYDQAPVAVWASLVAGRGRLTGHRRYDTFVNVEGIYGSPFNDVLIGDAGPNSLSGDVGNDSVSGGDGSDIIWGEDGDDNLNGGLPSGTAPGVDGDRVDGGNGVDECVDAEEILACES